MLNKVCHQGHRFFPWPLHILTEVLTMNIEKSKSIELNANHVSEPKVPDTMKAKSTEQLSAPRIPAPPEPGKIFWSLLAL